MGGAERAERKRKQAAEVARAATAVAAARDGGRSRVVVAGVAVVVLLAVVVGVGVWLQNRNAPEDLPAAVPIAQPAAEYPVAVSGEEIVAGDPGAPVTIDVYEDFLCPACGAFEETYGVALAQAVAQGRAVVRYHPVSILDEASEPEGYSTLAAGAAFCAAEAGIFPALHDSLFGAQPAEGGPAWTRPQLTQLGRDLGAGEDFARCVRQGNEQRIDSATRSASQRIADLRGDGQFGTPTVLVDGELADIGDPQWLEDALGAGAR
ncbi:MAG: DsbA family protein [Pseudonocardiaceae bacterium]